MVSPVRALARLSMIQHLGIELSSGFLRDMIVRKDRLTSGLAGPHGGPCLEKIHKKLIQFKEVSPQLAKDLTAARYPNDARNGERYTDLANRTFVLYLVLGLACRGIGGVDGKPISPCATGTVFDFSSEASRFEFDHWPETRDALNALDDIDFRVITVSSNYYHGYMDVVNLLCTSPRCNQCHMRTTEVFAKAATDAAANDKPLPKFPSCSHLYRTTRDPNPITIRSSSSTTRSQPRRQSH